jgi:hypothetical protein
MRTDVMRAHMSAGQLASGAAKITGPLHYAWQDVPSYDALHMRLRKVMQGACELCGGTTSRMANSLITPKRWGVCHGLLLLMGNDETDYVRMCIKCSKAYDQRVRREALATHFGIPLPRSEY